MVWLAWRREKRRAREARREVGHWSQLAQESVPLLYGAAVDHQDDSATWIVFQKYVCASRILFSRRAQRCQAIWICLKAPSPPPPQPFLTSFVVAISQMPKVLSGYKSLAKAPARRRYAE